MDILNNWTDVRAAMTRFAFRYGGALPDALAERYVQATGSNSDVDNAVNAAELLYANRGLIKPKEARAAAMTLAGQLAAFAAAPSHAFHGLADPVVEGGVSRGHGIWLAMARELGEDAPAGTAWPAAAEDPAPKPESTVESAT